MLTELNTYKYSRVQFWSTEGNLIMIAKKSFNLEFDVLFQLTKLNDLFLKLVLFTAHVMKAC